MFVVQLVGSSKRDQEYVLGVGFVLREKKVSLYYSKNCAKSSIRALKDVNCLLVLVIINLFALR